MIDEEFSIVGLYEHNGKIYRKIRDTYNSGENIVALRKLTGAGKTYIALQLAYDNKDKKTLLVVPAKSIIEHIKQIIDDNPNLDMKRDFPNLEFRTYQSFVNLSRKEIKAISVDILIVDEFHHIAAPVWGQRIIMLKKTHPKMKIFGMSAYTTWGRGTPYERDLTVPNTNELFSGKVVSSYDLVDAMIDGVLPKPIYRSVSINLLSIVEQLDEKINKLSISDYTYTNYKHLLKDIRKRITEAPSITDLMKSNIKSDGKYIYFCPIEYEQGVNDIESIKKEAYSWFKEFVPENDIVFYTTTSQMGDIGKLNRDAFYCDQTLDGEDASSKLRVMFAINQYNEGVHAPNVDGVILGRETKSDIVFFEEIGRALSVKGNIRKLYEEYDKYSKEKLISLAHKKGFTNISNIDKTEIIEKLLAPVIIDLSGNISFIIDLESRLNDRLMQIKKQGKSSKRQIKLKNASFDIDVATLDLFNLLQYLRNRLAPKSWDEWYELACEYQKNNGNIDIPYAFITTSDYTITGVKLGTWFHMKKVKYNNGTLEESKRVKLEEIGLVITKKDNDTIWQEWYDLACKYYEHHKNLLVPCQFKTKNGYEYDENGYALGTWIVKQRVHYRKGILTEDRNLKLSKIEMIYDIKPHALTWEEWYNLALNYYRNNSNLNVPGLFKTLNGYEYDEKGYSLGNWIYNQRKKFYTKGLSSEQIDKLKSIGMKFEARKKSDLTWNEWYKLAVKYYEYHHNLQIPIKYKTINGFEYNEDGEKLGVWLKNQKKFYSNDKISQEHIDLLNNIGIIWNNIQNENQLKELLTEYNIDYDMNKKFIKTIPYQIFKSKLYYLIDNNNPILIDNRFHELIFMSDIDMQKKYNISLKELIEKYSQTDKYNNQKK